MTTKPSGDLGLVKQPNSRNCFVCGLENTTGLQLRFYETARGDVVADVSLKDRFEGYPGTIHGGIIATMLDEAAGRAAMVGNPNVFTATARLEIRYRKPVPVEGHVRVIGRLVKRKGRLVTAHAELHLENGNIAAEAEVLLVDREGIDIDQAGLQELGWRVYPD
jgi:uncharacterized protein (TIGR00369 family)